MSRKKPKTLKIGSIRFDCIDTETARIDVSVGRKFSKEDAKDMIGWLQEFIAYTPWIPECGDTYHIDGSFTPFMRTDADPKGHAWEAVDLSTGEVVLSSGGRTYIQIDIEYKGRKGNSDE